MTAEYKASLVSGEKMVDLTGGYGVDTFFLSRQFKSADYVEQNEELCRIAEHNFNLPTPALPKGKEICVHHSTAEDFLQSAGWYDLIFVDPARRDVHGGKVFRLADCTPNVVELLPSLLAHLSDEGRILLKLSPMLDISQAVKELSVFSIQWSVYVVAVKNEVKEVLLIGTKKPCTMYEGRITAVDLVEAEKAFVFTKEEERDCPSGIGNLSLVIGHYLYEPNAAILKAGAYKLVAARFGLQKLDVNTHLYVSDEWVADFPGRVWKIEEPTPTLPKGREILKANVLCRNYPLTPEQVKKKYRIKDGGERYIIGCRMAGQPTLWTGERIQ